MMMRRVFLACLGFAMIFGLARPALAVDVVDGTFGPA